MVPTVFDGLPQRISFESFVEARYGFGLEGALGVRLCMYFGFSENLVLTSIFSSGAMELRIHHVLFLDSRLASCAMHGWPNWIYLRLI